MKMHGTLALLGVSLLLAGPVSAAEKTSAGKKSHEFMKEAASAGMMEVELGRIASTRAANPRVKEFGQRMIDDHGKANNELKEVAEKESVALPETMNDQHRATVARLSNLQGAAFDRAYMDAMVKDHQEDVEKFRQHTRDTDPGVRDFASKTLPTLQEHLKMAQEGDAETRRATSGAR